MKTPYQPSPALCLSPLASLPLFQRSASLHPQAPPWQGGGVYGHTSQYARLLQKPAPHSSKNAASSPGIVTPRKRTAWKKSLKWGSRNMPLFRRAHECKEYEHWSEKKVWIVSGMKWTLSKNKGDPQRTLVKPELTQAKRWTQTRL